MSAESAPTTFQAGTPGNVAPLGQIAGKVAGLTDQFSTLSGQLEEIHTMLCGRVNELDRKEADLAACTSELEERESQFLRKSDSLDQFESELQNCQADLTQTLNIQKADQAVLAEQRADLDRDRAAADTLMQQNEQRTSELDARERGLEEQARRLAGEVEQVDQARTHLVAERAEFERSRSELDGQRRELEQREAAFVALQENLSAREDAMKGFQAAFAKISDTFTSRSSDGDAGVGKGAGSPIDSSASVDAADGNQPATADDASSQITETSAVDEAKLDPEVRGKLRVMQRLTDGRVSDAELIARIRREAGTETVDLDSTDKSKRHWWGG